MLSIVECMATDQKDWDSFVQQHGGTYCHLFAWKAVFAHAYNLRTHYLSLRQDEKWMGLLPVTVMPHWPGGQLKAVSLPYCNYGGMLAAPGIDPVQLTVAAVGHLGQIGINQIELRELSAKSAVASSEVTMILRLPCSVDSLWNGLDGKVRNQVRKAQRSGLSVQWGADQMEDLYAIYAANMGRLGTPVHSHAFLSEILLRLNGQTDVMTVRLGNRPIGAMLLIKHGNTWADPIASCLAEYNNLNPNMLLYWEALRAACAAGAKCFDFGRSQRDSGTHHFKKQWGATETVLNYHTYRNGRLVQDVSTAFYRGRRASRLADFWRGLPFSLQRKLGPALRRWIP